jgi:hypothetical protein
VPAEAFSTGHQATAGVTDAWLTEYGVTLGVGALILFMVFIVWDLARRSNAGKFGTLILYIGLAMGIVGFLIKVVITYLLENAGV